MRIQKGLELLGWTKNLRLRVLVLGALSFTAAALVGRMTDYPFLIAFFGGAALFASAAALLYLRAMGEWTEDLGKSLPEAIDSIARICRAGVPAQTAFGLAAQNLRGALSEELRTIDRWLRLGVPLKQVLQESAHRVPLPEYRFFAVIVIISQESGGRLADTLGRSILVCVGDAPNDLAMLQAADYGFRTGDCDPAMRRYDFRDAAPSAEGSVASVIDALRTLL